MDILRTIIWKNLVAGGSEYFRIFRTEHGFRLDGQVVAPLSGKPYFIIYAINCDLHWNTQSIAVEQTQGSQSRSLQIRVDQDHCWWINEQHIGGLDGFIDVDLSISPSTNTLPINRLSLPLGASRELTAAWLRFPELELAPLPQRYTHVDEFHYRYDSLDSDFTAPLQVDDLGLVLNYGGYWKAEAIQKSPER